MMCLAVPGRVVSVLTEEEESLRRATVDFGGVQREESLRRATVDFGGVQREVSLAFTPEAAVGDYVLVHVGFALSVVDEAEAQRIFETLREMEELAGEQERGG